jgi:hypothetical protein
VSPPSSPANQISYEFCLSADGFESKVALFVTIRSHSPGTNGSKASADDLYGPLFARFRHSARCASVYRRPRVVAVPVPVVESDHG